jgi:hypothetical protein
MERLGHAETTGRTITLKVKFSDFRQITRSKTLHCFINDFDTLHKEVSERMKVRNPAFNLPREHFVMLGKKQKGKKRSEETKMRYHYSKLGKLNPRYKEFNFDIGLDFGIHAGIVPQDIISITENKKTRDPKINIGIKSSKPKSAYLVLGENEVILATPQIQVTGIVSNGMTSTIFIAQGVVPKDDRTIKGNWAVFRPMRGEGLNDKKSYGVEVAQDLARYLNLTPSKDGVVMTTTLGGQMNAMDIQVLGVFDTGTDNIIRSKFIFKEVVAGWITVSQGSKSERGSKPPVPGIDGFLSFYSWKIDKVSNLKEKKAEAKS